MPGSTTQRYGGNTSCIEVRCGDHLLILDAGTGLRALGNGLPDQVDADLLLTHTHLDHIVGLGFFEPLMRPGTRLRLHGGHLALPALTSALSAALSPPLMPDLWSLVGKGLSIGVLAAGRPVELHPGLSVTAEHLRHPGGSVGFRIEWRGRCVAYVTDTEHVPGQPDQAVLRLAREADIFIYDCNYTDDEFAQRIGWGHSTWQEGVRLAYAAGARRLVLFHHDPWRTDDALDKLGTAAAAALPGTVAAAEGMVLAV
ncbi:MBL fold metallo-hydrolase [Rhodopila sp.]|uniref:MBL fold metallo-hydrolase n=1 Tax=Rhodopila sp. TaxID=2480087 RepID=UPI002C382AB6|nr:MBL fold metallo-hydrolase [Rhodopila sp.]HVZ09172.1 MBL fold metallo-hydrolase [Rhodopila sp.]